MVMMLCLAYQLGNGSYYTFLSQLYAGEELSSSYGGWS